MPQLSRTRREGRFVIIASRFNRVVTSRLVDGARGVLLKAGVSPRAIDILWVPGAFELPVVAAHLARPGSRAGRVGARGRPAPDAIIAVGTLIRGETSQYEILANAVAQGLSQVAVTTGIPVTFGVIVADSAAQVRARAGGRMGNRGAEAAMAAVEVLRLFETLRDA